MGLHDFQQSKLISVMDFSFYAALFAAMRHADPVNQERFQKAFPGAWEEFREREETHEGRLGEEL